MHINRKILNLFDFVLNLGSFSEHYLLVTPNRVMIEGTEIKHSNE